jgi:hypothetical protein
MERNNSTTKRSADPLNKDEIGLIAGDIVVKKGLPVYLGGTVSRRAERDIIVGLPLDKGEVGTAWNSYNY